MRSITSFRFRRLGLVLVCLGGLLAAAPPTPSRAQEASLRGFVRDAETGQPLPGANVVVRRLTAGASPRGATANADGYYFVGRLAPGRYALRVSFVGYRVRRDTVRLSDAAARVTRTVELPPAEQVLDDVLVTGEEETTTPEAGRQQVGPEDLGRVPTPSISGDLASYLQATPGVVSVGDRGGRLFIRGGTPEQNLILMDKMQVYRPFHIVGFYSVFPQELVANADIYAGGFPARYSGRMSSVIDVEMRGGNREHLAGAVTAGPLLTGARLEGPLNDNGLSLLGTARFSQIERTAPTILGQEEPLRFNDQFVKLQNTFDTGRCGLTMLHTYDRGLLDPAADNVFRWSNYAGGGRCVGVGSASSALVDVSFSTSYVKNAVGTAADPEREASFWDVATKLHLTRPLDGRAEARGGLKFHLSELGYSLGEKFQGLRTENRNWITAEGYLEGTFPLGANLTVRPGLAVSFPFEHRPTLEPRLRAHWQPFGSPRQELSAAVGYYRQTIVGLTDERDLGSAFTAWVRSPPNRARPSAWHAILGWQQRVGPVTLTAEGYYKDMSNLSVPVWRAVARFTTELTGANGTSYGADLRAEIEQGPVYAYLGYGYSWTRYTAADGTFGTFFGEGVRGYHPAHDRRHELNAVLGADLGIATANVRWQLGSGRPATRPFGLDVYVQLRGLMQSPRTFGTPRLLYDTPYGARLPAYHRLDVSLERTIDLDAATLTVKGGAINLYDRQNLFYFDLFTQRRVNQLPLVPYLALEVEV